MLAGPRAEERARLAFRGQAAEEVGRLNFEGARAALAGLQAELGLADVMPLSGESGQGSLERAFAELDADGDGALEEGEFVELFSFAMRRASFERPTRRTREGPVFKRPGCVWDVYERLQQMGTGTFGKAYLCRHRFAQEDRAVKVVKKVRSKASEKEMAREVTMLQRLDHPHVVRLFEWYEDAQRLYLVMEALQGGTLQATLGDLQKRTLAQREEWSRKVLRQVLEAMAYCHSLRVIHKDLKDENIMLLQRDAHFDNPFAVIIDLGAAETLSTQAAGGHHTAVAGTPATMAPEVWNDQAGPKCDVWSAGCILFELLAGRLPFMSHGQRPEAWLALHRRGPDWSCIRTSSASRDLCVVMLRFHDSKRPSMVECLSHRWFTALPWDAGSVSPVQIAPKLLDFCRSVDARRSVLYDLAARLPMRRAHRVVEAFKAFDVDGNGSVSPEELRAALARSGLDDDDLVRRIFEVLDADKDGALSFTEFSAGVLPAFRELLDERFGVLFREHDTDADGALNLEEADRLLLSTQPPELAMRAGRLLGGLADKPGGRVRCAELHERLFGSSPLTQGRA